MFRFHQRNLVHPGFLGSLNPNPRSVCRYQVALSLNGTQWIGVLANITDNYNRQKHRTTGMKPCEINKNNEEDILHSTYNHIKLAMDQRKFKVGDLVRISKEKHVFEKGYTPNWTTKIFKIIKVRLNDPITYLLEDLQGRPISGGFYTEELQKAKHPDIYLVKICAGVENKCSLSG
ncbi:hypothetical protein NQ318_022838 [Aromia moschata]|uniref:Uncharacterized protein n=1 Tax=Aromia moschata TaxID=1265417 RepID=A0AAV8XWF4_9CUCU|nr:hypothetical protein NQ318_022838 [Aromia moschata]